MSEYSIGYRVKFDSANPVDIENFITDYLKLFDRYEIKVTKNLISSGNVELIIRTSEKKSKGKFSIHTLKNVLNNSEEYNLMADFIEILNKICISDEVYVVTHIPYNSAECLSRIIEISRKLPTNYTLLLENIDLESNNEEYLKQINDLCATLDEKNVKNIGICLDIGHLLYGCNKEKISEIKVFSQIQKMSNLLSRLKEIHIHDYAEIDHLQLNSGLMNLKLVSEFIKRNDINVPIIIENTVNEPSIDGVMQINIMRENLFNE